MKRILVATLLCLGLVACKSERPAEKPEAKPTLQADRVDPNKPGIQLPPANRPKPNPEASPALLDPSKLVEKAPEKFKVRFETTKGPFVVEVNRELAPHGADRLFNLVKAGFFQDVAFFRAIEGFMVQFGIHGNPEVASVWRTALIPDDPVKGTNARGTLTFATSGPNSRTTQLFINFKDKASLDGMGFAPLGKVVEGMDVVDSLYTGYGEGSPRGAGPNQGQIQQRGNEYLRAAYPELDYIESAKIVD
jgi:peptidyl-prolyl cis-trans isomerase A (cyclophilin A)